MRLVELEDAANEVCACGATTPAEDLMIETAPIASLPPAPGKSIPGRTAARIRKKMPPPAIVQVIGRVGAAFGRGTGGAVGA